MSRESESNYGYEDVYEDNMNYNDNDATYIEDMGDYYTDNDPHDMMEHQQDFRYDSDYSSFNDMERYNDVDIPSSYCIESKYTRVDDMDRYHDTDDTSSNDNEAHLPLNATSYGIRATVATDSKGKSARFECVFTSFDPWISCKTS
jgi:hypothetical protein